MPGGFLWGLPGVSAMRQKQIYITFSIIHHPFLFL